MSDTPVGLSRTSEADRRLDEVVTAYLKEMEAGVAPDPRAWLERYPTWPTTWPPSSRPNRRLTVSPRRCVRPSLRRRPRRPRRSRLVSKPPRIPCR